MTRLLALPERPTALFVCNDMMAMGVISAAHQAGLVIPRDLSIVGYDNVALAQFMSPRSPRSINRKRSWAVSPSPGSGTHQRRAHRKPHDHRGSGPGDQTLLRSLFLTGQQTSLSVSKQQKAAMSRPSVYCLLDIGPETAQATTQLSLRSSLAAPLPGEPGAAAPAPLPTAGAAPRTRRVLAASSELASPLAAVRGAAAKLAQRQHAATLAHLLKQGGIRYQHRQCQDQPPCGKGAGSPAEGQLGRLMKPYQQGATAWLFCQPSCHHGPKDTTLLHPAHVTGLLTHLPAQADRRHRHALLVSSSPRRGSPGGRGGPRQPFPQLQCSCRWAMWRSAFIAL
jgi:hypothetical protein